MLRVVLGLKDVYLGDAMLLPRGRAAGEVPQPRVEVADPMLDVQDGHRQSVAGAGVGEELNRDRGAACLALQHFTHGLDVPGCGLR